MKSSQYIALAIAVFALIWVGSGVLFSSASEPVQQNTSAEPVNQKPADVRVRKIKSADYSDQIEVTGRSRASRKVILKAETNGQLDQLIKEEGASVAQGDVLAKLELRDRQAKFTEAKERVNQRTIEYNAAKQLQNKGFNSKVKLAQALADLADAKAALSLAATDLEKIQIKAPFEGIIAEQDIEVGDYLATGNPLFTIVDLDPVEFVSYVSERNIQDVTLQAQAKIVLLNGEETTGTVSYIAPAADEKTRTFRVVVSAPNEDNLIKEGLTATMYIPSATHRAHKISPSVLSLNDAGQIGVKVVNAQNKVEFLPVKILADKPEFMWIEALGDEITLITVGQDFVIEGQTVNPVLSEEEGLL